MKRSFASTYTTLRFPARALLFLALSFSIVLAACKPGATPVPTETPALSQTPEVTDTSLPSTTPTSLPTDAIPVFILSLNDNGYAHLFGFSPDKVLPTRLTNGKWDDVTPRLSPDGKKVVFASNRNAYWDLYLMDLSSGQITRLTDTPAYDGDPAWSPDSQWIIYDSYIDDNVEIQILSTVTSGQTIRVTNNPSIDKEPTWSSTGRKIAFTSNRSGDNEIWVVNLDQPNAGIDVSQSASSSESHPVWSADGTKLAWASARPNEPDSIYVWDSTQPNTPARRIGSGDWPVWNDRNGQIATRLRQANQDYLIAYNPDGTIGFPATPIATIQGLDWRTIRVGSWAYTFQKASFLSPTPLWKAQIQGFTDVPNKRLSIVQLKDVQAPYPYLSDAVDEAFVALRQRVISETGWDALGSLAQADEPLTAGMDPGRGMDWLYTGRAFAINPVTLNAGWMLVVREDLDDQTYWRVYLRAFAQDGSQGEPMLRVPWDLTARYNLDPQAYDQGGMYMKSVPPGYWIDFTNLAQEYGWQRIPAQNNWRSYFAGTQFNEFVMTGGLDWHAAMLELYPPDIFITPTVVIPPTGTPTVTPYGYHYKTPTPTLTRTLTPNPTFTPGP